MKSAITVFLIFTAQILSAQYIREERFYTDETGQYRVEYFYNPYGMASTPLTSPPGEPHFPAKISVFEICDSSEVMICDSFDGVYIPGGCFEDLPRDMVAKAKRIAKEEIGREQFLQSKMATVLNDETKRCAVIRAGSGLVILESGPDDITISAQPEFGSGYAQSVTSERIIYAQPVRNDLPKNVVPKIPVGQWFEIEEYPGYEFKMRKKKSSKK